MDPINVSNYDSRDPFFGRPYIDQDIMVSTPVTHRMIHGGFENTHTRFRFHFPSEEDGYRGRMFTPVSGANGGTEDFFTSPLGEAIGGVSVCTRLGGYTVQCNQGHIGERTDPRAGEDPTLYGYRANAEAARFSKHVAAQIYGKPPHHSYVFGGSGGGRRSPLCLENAPDVWDGALPFMGGGDVAEPGNRKRLKGAQAVSFCTMFNVQRLLGDKLEGVIDAMAAGGSGDPFAGLNSHQREELAALYRLGYPRGDEAMIGAPMGQLWQWTAEADSIYRQDPAYFENFWTKPGYVGHDQPELLAADRIDAVVSIGRVLTPAEALADPSVAGPECALFRATVGAIAAHSNRPSIIEIDDLPGYRLGAAVEITSGKGLGRRLYAMAVGGNLLLCAGTAQDNVDLFSDVAPGDSVHIDNSRWLAYGYFARHHVMDEPQFDSLRLGGRPIYPQHPLADLSSFMGVCYSGHFEGKLLWVHHTHDASLWPPQGVVYGQAVLDAQGADAMRDRFRLRWTENAEHVPPAMLPGSLGRASNTFLIDYLPVIEQSLKDLIDWVEHGIEPLATAYHYEEGQISLPATAADRGGIQAVVAVTANGSRVARARIGETIDFALFAEMAPGAGTIIEVKWDFDGSGNFAFSDSSIDGKSGEVALRASHAYDRAGTYFATALVSSHRDGDVSASSCRIPNLSQARVVIT